MVLSYLRYSFLLITFHFLLSRFPFLITSSLSSLSINLIFFLYFCSFLNLIDLFYSNLFPLFLFIAVRGSGGYGEEECARGVGEREASSTTNDSSRPIRSVQSRTGKMSGSEAEGSDKVDGVRMCEEGGRYSRKRLGGEEVRARRSV